MDPIDMKKLETAIIYTQRIADGCNPVTNMPADSDSVINNPNVIRCMYFIKDILQEVQRNGGIGGGRKSSKSTKEPYPYELLKDFQYQEDKTIAHLLAQIHEPMQGMNIRKVAPQKITNWLKSSGYLVEGFSQEIGKNANIVTDKGKELGLYNEVKVYPTNTYLAVVFGKKAQEFVVEHLEKIVNGEVIE